MILLAVFTVLATAGTSPVLVAFIVATASLGAAFVTGRMANKQRNDEFARNAKLRSKERQADWDRQDLVADRALDAQLALARSQKAILDGADQAATDAEARGKSSADQLKQIHTLVNSDMTAAREAELRQTRISLALMRRVVAGESGGPSEDDLQAITDTEERINELEAILADRSRQQRIVNDQVEKVEQIEAAKGKPEPEPQQP